MFDFFFKENNICLIVIIFKEKLNKNNDQYLEVRSC